MGLFFHPEGIYRAVGNTGLVRALPQAARDRVIIIASSRASRRLAVCFIMFFLFCF